MVCQTPSSEVIIGYGRCVTVPQRGEIIVGSADYGKYYTVRPGVE